MPVIIGISYLGAFALYITFVTIKYIGLTLFTNNFFIKRERLCKIIHYLLLILALTACYISIYFYLYFAALVAFGITLLDFCLKLS
jgi:hypothetical protein